MKCLALGAYICVAYIEECTSYPTEKKKEQSVKDVIKRLNSSVGKSTRYKEKKVQENIFLNPSYATLKKFLITEAPLRDSLAIVNGLDTSEVIFFTKGITEKYDFFDDIDKLQFNDDETKKKSYYLEVSFEEIPNNVNYHVYFSPISKNSRKEIIDEEKNKNIVAKVWDKAIFFYYKNGNINMISSSEKNKNKTLKAGKKMIRSLIDKIAFDTKPKPENNDIWTRLKNSKINIFGKNKIKKHKKPGKESEKAESEDATDQNLNDGPVLENANPSTASSKILDDNIDNSSNSDKLSDSQNISDGDVKFTTNPIHSSPSNSPTQKIKVQTSYTDADQIPISVLRIRAARMMAFNLATKDLDKDTRVYIRENYKRLVEEFVENCIKKRIKDDEKRENKKIASRVQRREYELMREHSERGM
ncbi:hypothetical protein NEMIN01_0509 [Nematocida minor]|uniref:uncharacterized protein n=1 Tax=Nematocida minor TaxID=1912983 RepID=UPI00221EF46A|nr:uncharacterized protein NEMIN01_0509 [Nematocida minor]KAI5189446.1 hypothetical protein NEMIN01_0509 [Nematocida minor]